MVVMAQADKGKTMRAADLTNVKVGTIDRLNNSRNGNPKYRVTFVTMSGEYVGTYTTATDASVAYEICNREFRTGPVAVWLSKRGTVEYASVKVSAS